ncbi:hypothetical protein BKA62DRAFT_335635 [Auriculariales sp. MPI-PUGE-AT-0066]|nr:hypothetical protein BKA62DRAFT_335635 [Auriculariales sp. MPI-PUGE-AT-0066]
MDEASIGMLLSVRAAMQIIGLSFLPIFERRLGPGRLYRPMSIAWLLTFPLFPLASFFARLSSKSNHPLVWANILVIYTMRTLTAVCWPCLSIMLNTAATSPEALTRLNALSQFTIVIPKH